MAIRRERDLKFGLGTIVGSQAIHNEDEQQLERVVTYNYLTAIVRDVISNPYEYLNQSVDGEDLPLKDFLSNRVTTRSDGKPIERLLSNAEWVDYMPMNSVIAHIVDGGESKDGAKPVICFPFFPQHLSLPVKPGEYVWVLKETGRSGDIYYWVCKKTGIRQIDDLNYTNLERTSKLVDVYSSWEKLGGRSVESTDLLTANSLDSASESNMGVGNTLASILNESYAHKKEFTGEPVPRLAKKCGDYLLQGSNNAGILFTNEKFEIGDTTAQPEMMTDKVSVSLKNRQPQSPAIDIFVHRKYRELTSIGGTKDAGQFKSESLNITKNSSEDDINTFYEIDKTADALNDDSSAFDGEIKDTVDDIRNVSNRLYMSSNTKIDELFSINFDNLAAVTGPAGMFYSKNARVFGEHTLRVGTIATENYMDMTAEGNVSIKASNIIALSSPIEGGIKAISVGGEGGAVLSVKPIQDFIETWKALTPSGKSQFPPLLPVYTTAGGGAAPVGALIVVPFIEVAIPILEVIIEELATKYFFAE